MVAGLSESKAVQPAEQDNTARFQPIEKTTIPGEIIDQILSMLLTGKLKAGDRLPPERQLCESFNVGRSSVREALKALEILGIIRRDIRGTTVCAPDENRYPSLLLSASSAPPLEQIFETARIVGIEAAGLAAERANREAIDKMLNVMQEADDMQKAAAIHLSFHRALVDATQNRVLSQMYNMLVALLSQSSRLSSISEELKDDERKAFMEEISDGHRKILKAVESHNPTAAKESMKEHYECMAVVALKQ